LKLPGRLRSHLYLVVLLFPDLQTHPFLAALLYRHLSRSPLVQRL
jgi:hypothetical protein